MTPDEMRARSSEKVKQIMDLMRSLNVRVEAREKLGMDGFIEKMVFWIDDENYPSPAPETEAQEEAAPAAEEAPITAADEAAAAE